MDRGACWAPVHGVAQSRTRLSDFTFTFHFHALKKEMSTHSSFLAWRIPGMAEPGWEAIYGVSQSQTRLKRLSSSSSRLVITFFPRSKCPHTRGKDEALHWDACPPASSVSAPPISTLKGTATRSQEKGTLCCIFLVPQGGDNQGAEG